MTDVPLSMAEKQAQLEAKLQPERIRATLAFAGLYQIAHTMIQRAVVVEVREYYCIGFNEKGMRYDEAGYQAQVLSRDPKSKFRASLLWLVNNGAISMPQADRLKDIYGHRHDLTHELVKYIVDVKFEPDVDLFVDALEILSEIRRFWTQIEIDIGSFEDVGEVDVEEVQPLSLLILSKCIQAYVAGLPQQPENPDR